MILSDWGQEDVEDHCEDDEDYVAHYTEPETWVFEELLVVGAEEDVTDGHPGDNPPEMGHKGDLVEGRSNKRGVSEAISLIKSSVDPPTPHWCHPTPWKCGKHPKACRTSLTDKAN